jgi:hypothetical protein
MNFLTKGSVPLNHLFLVFFGISILQALARFIIEEGGYGSTLPNSHGIMEQTMLDKIITDINKESSLREFIKIYLTKINNDLKSMVVGGGKP